MSHYCMHNNMMSYNDKMSPSHQTLKQQTLFSTKQNSQRFQWYYYFFLPNLKECASLTKVTPWHSMPMPYNNGHSTAFYLPFRILLPNVLKRTALLELQHFHAPLLCIKWPIPVMRVNLHKNTCLGTGSKRYVKDGQKVVVWD